MDPLPLLINRRAKWLLLPHQAEQPSVEMVRLLCGDTQLEPTFTIQNGDIKHWLHFPRCHPDYCHKVQDLWLYLMCLVQFWKDDKVEFQIQQGLIWPMSVLANLVNRLPMRFYHLASDSDGGTSWCVHPGMNIACTPWYEYCIYTTQLSVAADLDSDMNRLEESMQELFQEDHQHHRQKAKSCAMTAKTKQLMPSTKLPKVSHWPSTTSTHASKIMYSQMLDASTSMSLTPWTLGAYPPPKKWTPCLSWSQNPHLHPLLQKECTYMTTWNQRIF